MLWSGCRRKGYQDVLEERTTESHSCGLQLPSISGSCIDNALQKFCKEAVVWRFLRHPNVLPLIGVVMTETRFAMVSVWMENGNINEFIAAHPEADRLSLVGCPKASLSFFDDEWRLLAGGRRQWTDIPPQQWNDSWGPQGSMSLIARITLPS